MTAIYTTQFAILLHFWLHFNPNDTQMIELTQ